MVAEPSVSIVIPALNGADTIADLLTALVNQTGTAPPDEVIVVDNGSTDRTAEVAKRFPVTVLGEPRRGAAVARNAGMRRARGDVIVFADADTLPTHRWLARLVSPFADATTIVAGGVAVDYRASSSSQRFVAQVGVRQLEYEFFRGRLPYVAAESMAVRREALIAVGGWDESFYTAEDLDVCVRLYRRFGCVPTRCEQAVFFSRRRTTFEALFEQAWNYGQGLAQAHLHYPEIVPLNLRRWIVLGRTLWVRRAKAVCLSTMHNLGLGADDAAELARQHWLWSRSFWGGFFSMLRHRTWRRR